MLDWLPALGARKKAQLASLALRRGAIDEASAACRAYFARRLTRTMPAFQGVDAQMAALTALCATLRGDDRELEAIKDMVGESPDKSAVAARAAVKWLSAALKGDLEFVLNAMPRPDSVIAPHASAVVLLAVERSTTTTPAQGEMLRRHLARPGGTVEAQARASCALAVAALRSGDRAAAVRYLAEIPASAPPFHQVLAAVAREDVDAIAELIAALPAEERGAAITVAAALVLGSSSATSARVLEALGSHASSAARATLSASVAVALAREGQGREALRVLQSETRGPPSPTLAIAAAFVALIDKDAAAAQSALRAAPPADPTVAALRLIALALGGQGDDLLRELGTKPELLPEHRHEVASTLLFALARAGIAPSADRSPPWLLDRPSNPESLYAWGMLRLRQGAAEEASVAFTAAILALPDLAALGDAPEVASVMLARQRVLEGNPEDATALIADVSSARLTGTATRLAALAYVQSAARKAGVTLSADTLPSFVEKLALSLPPSSHEAKLLTVLQSEVTRAQVRQLLRSGAGKKALAHLDELRSSWDGDAVFLHVAVMLSQGAMTPAEAEESLAQALALEPEHEGLRVLLAEVQTFLRGAEVGLATLAAAGGALRGTLLVQALASAYRGARRGLEAKRFGFAELRRAATAPAALVAELRDVLRFEVPVRTADDSRERIARVPAGALIPEANLQARAHLLLARAGAAAQRDPSLRVALDAATQCLKRALMLDDAAGARSAELEIVELMARVAA